MTQPTSLTPEIFDAPLFRDPAKTFRDNYLRAPKPEFFDTVDHEFARRKGPRYDQSRAYNTSLFVSAVVRLGGKKFTYCAGAISKGMLAHAAVRKEQPQRIQTNDGSLITAYHVYDLDETIGTQHFLDKVIGQNKRLQLQKQAQLNLLSPEDLVLVPTALQGGVSVAGQPNFDLGSKRRDKDFMQLWTALIREHANAFLVQGDWFFSGATSGQEYPEAIAIAAGLRKRRPDADMSFPDINGKEVTLFEMSKRISEFLLFAADDKYPTYLKHEATTLMRNFAIREMAEKGQLPNANPVFLKGIMEHLPEMKQLQRAMEPLIVDRVKSRLWEIDLSDMESVNPSFVKKCLAAKAAPRSEPQSLAAPTFERLEKSGINLHRYNNEEIAQGDYEFKEIAAKFPPQDYIPRTEGDAKNRVLRSADMRGEATRAFDGKSLFSCPLLPITTERERLLASIALGGMETVTPTANRLYYIAADDKYGAGSLKAKIELNLAHEDEVPAAVGTGFAAIRRANIAIVNKLQEALQGADFQTVTAFDFQKSVATMAKNAKIAVAAGEAKLGSAARALVRHAFMARNVTDFCFPKGVWEKSNDCVQDMVLATRMQLGLQAGSLIDPQHVRVVDEHGRCLTIADRIEAIWEPLKEALKKGRDAKDLEEPVTALAQLWSLHRLVSDHTMRSQVFNKLRKEEPQLILPQEMKWDRIPPFIFAYDHKNLEDLWKKEIRPAFEDKLIMSVRMNQLEHIDDFMLMRARQEAKIALAEAGAPEYRSIRRRLGGSVPG